MVSSVSNSNSAVADVLKQEQQRQTQLKQQQEQQQRLERERADQQRIEQQKVDQQSSPPATDDRRGQNINTKV